MILDEIVLHGFGLYAERQRIALTPPDGERSIVLFGGLNGHGKTTLLDAMQLCLYGAHARLSNRNGLSYQDYLSRSVHRGSGTREAAIELVFRHTTDGQEDRFRLHRSWRPGGNGLRERFEVLKNRRRDDALAKNWIAQVEDLIPPNIANLFLFDGEQVEGYAAPENSARLIGTAVHNLLGLDVVEQLDKDLQTYQRRKRGEEKDDPRRGNIEAAEAELKDLRARMDGLRQEQAGLATNRIAPTRMALREVEDQYRKLGGELHDERAVIERDLKEAERELHESAERLRELAAGGLPLLAARGLLDAVVESDRAEEETRRAREMAEVLAPRDKKLLEFLRARGINADDLAAVADRLGADREARRKAGERGSILDLPPEARADLRGLVEGGLEAAAREAVAGLSRWREAGERVDHLRTVHASVPGEDAIADAAHWRDEMAANLAKLEADEAAIKSEIERLARDVERREQALSRLLEVDAEAAWLRDDRRRVLSRTARVRTTLGAFRKAVVERHARRIEHLVLESYQQLLRKASLVTRLAIDAETFALALFGRDGRELDAERLSAGERQLLAVALLWGLAKASGRPLPTAIDTPLGRLDAGHRTHLVERYFPFASHQVLLFSTDEEIVGAHLEKLRPYVGRCYRLDYDDDSGSTRIAEGYFEGETAA